MSAKKQSKKAVLPKNVYVTYYNEELPEDDDDNWLEVWRELGDPAEKDDFRTVGVYELKEIKKIRLKVTEELVEENR